MATEASAAQASLECTAEVKGLVPWGRSQHRDASWLERFAALFRSKAVGVEADCSVTLRAVIGTRTIVGKCDLKARYILRSEDRHKYNVTQIGGKSVPTTVEESGEEAAEFSRAFIDKALSNAMAGAIIDLSKNM